MSKTFNLDTGSSTMSSFHWADYLLCGLSLFLSVGVGIFYGIRDRHRDRSTTEEFLVGGRKLKILPVSLSIFVSWMSAISFIGDPVEVYYHGVVYIFIGLGYCLPLPIVAHFFAPVLNSMKLISAYEYIEKRYNMATRILSSLSNIACGCLYLGIVIYAPSVALSQVTGLREWISILLIGTVGTFYTVLGGIKAVVWADAIQSVIMLAGVLAVVIQGIIRVGGIKRVWQIAEQGNRLNFLQNSWSPLVQSSVWIYVVGGFFRVLMRYVSDQSIIQRYLVLPSPRAATIAVYLNMPMYLILSITFTLIGLTMYAFYAGCDPLLLGKINHPDQLVPLFMLEMLGFLPGLPGLFLASLFAAALSTLSSVINSSATNIVKDFIEPFYLTYRGKLISDQVTTWLVKVITLLLGILVTVLAFATLYVKVNIFPLTARLLGMILGPVSALFICGMCCTFVKTRNIFIASVISLSVCIWLGIGSFIYPPPSEALLTSASVCLGNNYSNIIVENVQNGNGSFGFNINHKATVKEAFNISNLYNLSNLLYSPLGCMLTIIITLILSVVQWCCTYIISKYRSSRHFLPQIKSNRDVEIPKVV